MCRFLAAALILWGLTFTQRLPLPPKSKWLPLLGAGLVNGAGYCLIYFAEQTITGASAAVVYAIQPLIIAAILAAIGLEQVRRSQVILLTVAACGIGLVFAGKASVSSSHALAFTAVVCAVSLGAVYTILLKKLTKEGHPLASTSFFITGTFIPPAMVWLASGEAAMPNHFDWSVFLAFLHLTLMGTVVAKTLYIVLVRHVSLLVVATLVFVTPIIALLVDLVFEPDARLLPVEWLGIFITIASVVVNWWYSARVSKMALLGDNE